MIVARTAIMAISLLFAAPPCLAMNNYDDPRVILSYMDKSLPGAQDILRVTTVISGEQLIFQVKTREQLQVPEEGDYMLLQIWQERAHQILVPLGDGRADTLISYASSAQTNRTTHTLESGELGGSLGPSDFSIRRVPRGVEFLVPLTWLEYGQKLGFDAYTIRGHTVESSFVIDKIYDRAAKADREERLISPIMLLNNLCATRR